MTVLLLAYYRPTTERRPRYASVTISKDTILTDKKHDGKDGDGNKNKAEDESAAAIADCDKNDVERAGFDCFGIAINDLEIEEESNGPPG
jgi:hypothetical protein